MSTRDSTRSSEISDRYTRVVRAVRKAAVVPARSDGKSGLDRVRRETPEEKQKREDSLFLAQIQLANQIAHDVFALKLRRAPSRPADLGEPEKIHATLLAIRKKRAMGRRLTDAHFKFATLFGDWRDRVAHVESYNQGVVEVVARAIGILEAAEPGDPRAATMREHMATLGIDLPPTIPFGNLIALRRLARSHTRNEEVMPSYDFDPSAFMDDEDE